MLLDEKPLQDIDLADSERLITEPICESLRVEYKREWWGRNDEGRREMLRDISSFANPSGGYIVLGIETERDELECPTSIIGMERSNYTEIDSRSCRDNLDPPCNGIESAQIEVDTHKVLVLVKVPQSLDAPHMVTFKGLNQFWKRYGTDKQPMRTREIRDEIMNRLSYQDQILQLAQQGALDFRNAHLNSGGLLYVWADFRLPDSIAADGLFLCWQQIAS